LNLLLDTRVALWAITDDPRLPKSASELIQSPRTIVWVSAVSIWEISIKFSLGKGDMPMSGKSALGYFQEAGYRLLAIEAEHTIAIEQLQQIHHDPFDRLLVAQALQEPMRLMTHNATVARYSDTIILV